MRGRIILAGWDPEELSLSDLVAVTRVAIVEQGERVEAVDTWLDSVLFAQRAKPQDLEEWASDPAWLAEQEEAMKALGAGS